MVRRVIELTQWIYHLVYFYYNTLLGICRKQSLALPQSKITYSYRFYFTKTKRAKWFNLFKISRFPVNIPFTFYTPIAVRAFLRTLNHLKINYKNILHLQHEEKFLGNVEPMQPNTPYRIEMRLDDIVFLRGQRIALLFNLLVFDEKQQQEFLQIKDVVFVKNISQADLLKLKDSKIYGNHTDRSLMRLALRKPKFNDLSPIANTSVPKKMGVHYGMLSGDMNFIHTSKNMAKLFGYKDTFVQGMCTINYLLRAFCYDSEQKSFKGFRVTFTNPVYESQQVYVRLHDHDFELSSSCGEKLLAYGEILP